MLRNTALLEVMPRKQFSNWVLRLLRLDHLSPESLLCFANEELLRKACGVQPAEFYVGEACSFSIAAPRYLRASANMGIRLFTAERLDIQVDFFHEGINISTCKHYVSG